jgi:hypothetical protein
MPTVTNERLESFLTECGLAWSVIPWGRHVSLNSEWQRLYGDFRGWLRYKNGSKAEFEYSFESAERFTIVPFLTDLAGPLSIHVREPRVAAYECQGEGDLPGLGDFAGIEFFVAPEDFNWSMIHTHEDHALGGPYFVRKEWLGSLPRNRAR